jgi:hypothetical protein
MTRRRAAWAASTGQSRARAGRHLRGGHTRVEVAAPDQFPGMSGVSLLERLDKDHG